MDSIVRRVSYDDDALKKRGNTPKRLNESQDIWVSAADKGPTASLLFIGVRASSFFALGLFITFYAEPFPS